MKKRLPRERSLEVDPSELRRRLWLVFAILGLLIGALAVTAVGIAREIHDSARTSYLRQAFPLSAATRDLALQLVNEETGVRGYVITGHRSSLAPYSSGRRAAVADARLLVARAEHDPQLAVLVPPVMRLRAQLNAFFAKEIRLVEAGSRGRNRAVAQVESGKEVFDRFRFAIASVQALATIRVEQASARQDTLFTRLALIVGVAGLLALVLVGLLAWRIPWRIFILLRSEQRAREKAERLQRETEAVQSLTVDLSASLTAEQIHAALVKAARDLLGADSTSFVLVDEHDGEGAVERSPHAGWHEGRAAVRDGQPRYLEELDAHERFASAAILPLAAPQERPRGYIAFYYASPHAFPRSERARLRVVASQVESALRRAEAHDRERRDAHTLQRALLPDRLPAPAHARLVGQYRPAAGRSLVGGDWYDAVEHQHGLIAGSVGDVAGHGILAAAQMGRLRHSYRAYALEHNSPAEILARLTRHTRTDSFATAFCFDLDPQTRRLRYSGAGHPPAIVHLPDSGKTILLASQAPPLGFATENDFADTTISLPGRAILFAYTDGLIEERGSNLNERIQTLCTQIAETPNDDLEHYVDTILRSMQTPDSNPDDIAVLAIIA